MSVDVTELRVLVRDTTNDFALSQIFAVKQSKVDSLFSQFRVNVLTVRRHVNIRFFQTFRIKQFIEHLVGEFLAERPADPFIISPLPDIPDRVPRAVNSLCDLGVVVLEAFQPQDFAIIYHDHRPPYNDSHTFVCRHHYRRTNCN